MRANGINPRTGQPYKRGGTYKRGGSAAQNIRDMKNQSKASQDAAAAKEDARERAAERAADRARIAELELQVQTLNTKLALQEKAATSEKEAAVLEASANAGEKMLQRYRDGLRDGAMLSRGGPFNLAGFTPDSACGSSPYSFSQGPTPSVNEG